jgi:hypothetical protein
MLIQVISIKNQRFSLGVKDATVWYLCLTVAGYIVHLGDLQRSHHREGNLPPTLQSDAFNPTIWQPASVHL